jgi:hypothetical protein
MSTSGNHQGVMPISGRPATRTEHDEQDSLPLRIHNEPYHMATVLVVASLSVPSKGAVVSCLTNDHGEVIARTPAAPSPTPPSGIPRSY